MEVKTVIYGAISIEPEIFHPQRSIKATHRILSFIIILIIMIV